MNMSAHVVEGYRLSPQQKHLWLLQRAQRSSPYRTEGVLRISGSLDTARLQSAFARVIERHEILRTTFHRVSGMTLPVQVIGSPSLPPIQEFDLRACLPQDQAAQIEIRSC
jgi:hypothetical protein